MSAADEVGGKSPTITGFEPFMLDPFDSPFQDAPPRRNTAAGLGNVIETAFDFVTENDKAIAQDTQQEESEDQKKMRRVLANRRSAKASRLRRRQAVARLTARVDIITAENRSIKKDNSRLRTEIQEIREQIMLTLAVIRNHQHTKAATLSSPTMSYIHSTVDLSHEQEPAVLRGAINTVTGQMNPLHQDMNA